MVSAHGGRGSARSRAGFTLIEALIAMTLSALVLGMITSLMIAQGQYFGDVSRRTELRGTVRSVVDLVRADLQSVTRGSGTGLSDRAITTAAADQMILRVPLTIGTVCTGGSGGRGGSAGAVYLPRPGGGITNDRVTGWGYTSGTTDESGTDDWVFATATWTSLNVGGGTPKLTCFNQGLDTIGGGTDFYSVSGSVTSSADDGELFALFTEVEFTIDDSGLRPGTQALFRREGTGSLIEFASGLTTGSAFAYRRDGQTAFQSAITNANQLSTIAEVRLTIEAERQDPVTGATSTYEWITRVPLRNIGN